MAEARFSILVVDDDAADLEVVSSALEPFDCRLHLVSDPHDVLPSAYREEPDVVVLDALLPGLSGFDLCKQIKTDDALGDTRVIIVTGVYLREQYRQEALQIFKADGFLTKPFRPPELQRMVAELLSEKTRTPVAPLLARLGLSSPSAEPLKKRGFLERLFGSRRESEPIRIAPAAARETDLDTPDLVADASPPVEVLAAPASATDPESVPTESLTTNESEAPPSEELMSEAPVSEEPVSEVPESDEPVSDEPVRDEPVREQPVSEKPVSEEPVSEEPVSEEPVSEVPESDEPVSDEPVRDEPVRDEPVRDEPVRDEPVREQPVSEEPVSEKPVSEVPVSEEPVSEEPVSEEPESEEPTSDERDVPSGADPTAVEPNPTFARDTRDREGPDSVEAWEPEPAPVPSEGEDGASRAPASRTSGAPLYGEEEFQAELKRALAQCRRVDRPLSLVLIRIQDLAQIVELFGSGIRGPVLQHVARQAAESIREADVVGVFTSEPLVAVAAFASSPYGARRVASRVKQALERAPFRVSEDLPPIAPALGFGISSYPEDADHPSALLESASDAIAAR